MSDVYNRDDDMVVVECQQQKLGHNKNWGRLRLAMAAIDP
jgi:hypothetical protein